MGDSDDLIVGLGALVVGVALIFWGFIIWAFVSFTISAIVAAYRYQKYLKEARATYDEVEDEIGANLFADDVIRAVWGSGVELHEDGFENAGDWFTATILGEERQ